MENDRLFAAYSSQRGPNVQLGGGLCVSVCVYKSVREGSTDTEGGRGERDSPVLDLAPVELIFLVQALHDIRTWK